MINNWYLFSRKCCFLMSLENKKTDSQNYNSAEYSNHVICWWVHNMNKLDRKSTFVTRLVSCDLPELPYSLLATLRILPQSSILRHSFDLYTNIRCRVWEINVIVWNKCQWFACKKLLANHRFNFLLLKFSWHLMLIGKWKEPQNWHLLFPFLVFFKPQSMNVRRGRSHDFQL